MDPRHTKVAVALLVVGVLMHVGRGQFLGGDAAAEAALWKVARNLAVGLPLMLGSCFLTARIMGISFGSLPAAVLKLSAIYVFPGAVALLLGLWAPWYVGPLVALFLFCTLLTRLFELDGIEPLVCGLVMWLVTLGAAWFWAGT